MKYYILVQDPEAKTEELTDYELKAASTEVGGSDCLVESGLHQTRVQGSNHLARKTYIFFIFFVARKTLFPFCLLFTWWILNLPGEFAKEEDK